MDMTARLGLPLLAVAQAAKEMTVNEALTLLDISVQAVVEGEAAIPPLAPAIGQCWLVIAGASGTFAGHVGAVACWTAGGWRFVMPVTGMAVWRRDLAVVSRRAEGGWTYGAAITIGSEGDTMDVEARIAITSILARLRDHGLIAVP